MYNVWHHSDCRRCFVMAMFSPLVLVQSTFSAFTFVYRNLSNNFLIYMIFLSPVHKKSYKQNNSSQQNAIFSHLVREEFLWSLLTKTCTEKFGLKFYSRRLWCYGRWSSDTPCHISVFLNGVMFIPKKYFDYHTLKTFPPTCWIHTSSCGSLEM